MNIFKFYDKPQIVTVEPFSGIFGGKHGWLLNLKETGMILFLCYVMVNM